MVGTSSSKTSNTKGPQSSTRSSTSSTTSGRSPAMSTKSSTTSQKKPVNSTRSASSSGRSPGPTTSTRSSTSSSDSKPRSSTRSSTTSRDKSKVSKPVVTKSADTKSNNKSSTSKTSEKTNPSHPHPLEKVHKDNTYKCDGCKMRGAGTRYKCKPCKFNLHPDCMFARSKITFEGHKCQLYRKPLRCRNVNCSHGDICRSCDACGMSVEGFVYHCQEKDKDFHPSCAKLKSEIRIEDVIFKLEKHASSKCLSCQKKKLEGTSKKLPGWSYVSNRNGYSLHVHCLTDMVTKFIPSKTANKKGSDMALALRNVELPLESKSKGNVAIGRWRLDKST